MMDEFINTVNWTFYIIIGLVVIIAVGIYLWRISRKPNTPTPPQTPPNNDGPVAGDGSVYGDDDFYGDDSKYGEKE